MKLDSEQAMLDFGADFAQKLLKDSKLNQVIELVGDVGSGKTTFTRGLAAGLSIKEPITSPSFTISKSYAFSDLQNNTKILDHYDFYRLDDPGLMLETLEDSIKDGHLVVLEWADSVENILPRDHTKITIKLNDDDTREVIL